MPGFFRLLVFICELCIHFVVFGNEVDDLVRHWAPLVWLAPGEKFMPSDVEIFLNNVCVADDKKKCIFPKLDTDVAQLSTKDWNLITVDPIEKLLDNTDSFLFGKKPIQNSVSIYAVVTQCEPENEEHFYFHVSYWIFYPYNEGKNFCEIGGVPILEFLNPGLCSWKTLGNHVGDWEHMSLLFVGKNVPQSAFLAVHTTGAYYTYNEQNRYFQFDRAEERKDINPTPDFPPTLYTQDDHPIVFSAKGSHGTWSAPGDHQYSTIPKLSDKTGYGVPWNTWNKVEINHLGVDPLPYWMKFKGKWGNPKKNCILFNPFEICEYSDGPQGIIRQSQDFNCS